jgi:hypothetical protein
MLSSIFPGWEFGGPNDQLLYKGLSLDHNIVKFWIIKIIPQYTFASHCPGQLQNSPRNNKTLKTKVQDMTCKR